MGNVTAKQQWVITVYSRMAFAQIADGENPGPG